jgi:hypothetical protein
MARTTAKPTVHEPVYVPIDDFEEYVRSDDGRRQIGAVCVDAQYAVMKLLASIRRGLGRAIPQAIYARLCTVILAELADERRRARRAQRRRRAHRAGHSRVSA